MLPCLHVWWQSINVISKQSRPNCLLKCQLSFYWIRDKKINPINAIIKFYKVKIDWTGHCNKNVKHATNNPVSWDQKGKTSWKLLCYVTILIAKLLHFLYRMWQSKMHWSHTLLTTISIYTHTPVLTAIFPGLPRWAGTRKVKPIWILLKQETVSGSGISWPYASLHLAPDK